MKNRRQPDPVGPVQRVLGVALCVLIVGVPVSAHHAFTAEFDADRPVQLRGIVSKVELINPHSWIHIDVTGEDGEVVSWAIEGGTPNTLFRQGVTQNTLPPGVEVLVDGYQAIDGSNKANGRDITLTDGRRIFIGGASPGAPDQ
jgi:hypothetical protein